MTEQGVVLSVKKDFAKVRVGRNSACASCGKCGMTEKQKHVDFFASNTVGAKEGDTVTLNIPEANSAKFALVGYFLPIVPALGAMFLALGLKWAEWIAALLFLGGLVVGFALVALADKLHRHKWMETPQIVEVVNSPVLPQTVSQSDVNTADNAVETPAEMTDSDPSNKQNNNQGDNKNE